MSRSDGDKEYHCNWVAFSKAIHNIIKELTMITLAASKDRSEGHNQSHNHIWRIY